MPGLRGDAGIRADRSHVRMTRNNDTWADRYDVVRAYARWYLRWLPNLRWILVGRCCRCHLKRPFHKMQCARRTG